MEKLTIYDFPHFEKFEAMYNFLNENVHGVVSVIDCKYFADAFFVAFLQTIAFFIVAARYDKIQKRKEFLNKIYPFLFLPSSIFAKGMSVLDFRFALACQWNILEANNIFPKKEIEELRESLIFLEEAKEKESMIKGFNEKREKLKLSYLKMERLKPWIIF